MNGPDHYLESERLLRDAKKASVMTQWLLDAAQVHATLAQAAASVQILVDGRPETVGARDWRRMLTQEPSQGAPQ